MLLWHPDATDTDLLARSTFPDAADDYRAALDTAARPCPERAAFSPGFARRTLPLALLLSAVCWLAIYGAVSLALDIAAIVAEYT